MCDDNVPKPGPNSTMLIFSFYFKLSSNVPMDFKALIIQTPIIYIINNVPH